MMKSQFEVTRKHLRTLICEYDQSHKHFDLRVYGHMLMQSHILNDKAWDSIHGVSFGTSFLWGGGGVK